MLTTEAIVLKSVDYRDHQKILTLFTHEEGILSLFVNHLSPKDLQRITLCSPLTCATYILKKGNKDLYKLIDATLHEGHFELRRTIQHLKAALEMLKLIHHTQMPGKPAPALYQLLKVYLKQLHTTSHIDALLISFCLKLLIHEGSFNHTLTPSIDLAFIQSFDELATHTPETDEARNLTNSILST